MTKRTMSGVLLAGAALCLFAGPLLAEGSKDFEGLSPAWQAAYSAGDAGAVAALYTEDAVLMPPNAPSAKGRAAIEAAMTDVMIAMPAKLEVTAVDLGHEGNMGFAMGTYTFTDGGNVIDKGKWVEVRKKIKGKWYIHYDMWNSDMPLPE